MNAFEIFVTIYIVLSAVCLAVLFFKVADLGCEDRHLHNRIDINKWTAKTK